MVELAAAGVAGCRKLHQHCADMLCSSQAALLDRPTDRPMQWGQMLQHCKNVLGAWQWWQPLLQCAASQSEPGGVKSVAVDTTE